MSGDSAPLGLAVGERVPEALASASVLDRTGRSTQLGALCRDTAALFVFLRHFGCIGCSENVAELVPRLGELEAVGVRVVLIGCGAPTFIDGFVERLNLVGARVEVFTDPTLAAHAAVGLRYGFWPSLGPRGLVDIGKAFLRGHVNGPLEGDPRQQAGVVLLDRAGVVRFLHRNRSLGDHAPAQRIVEAALAAFARGRGT